MKLTKILPVLVVSLMIPSTVTSGEWCCHDAREVIQGSVDPEESCGTGAGYDAATMSVGELYACAFHDILRTWHYPVNGELSPYDKDTWEIILKHIPRLSSQYFEVRNSVRRNLLTSLSYMVPEGRESFTPLFKGAKEETIWNVLAETTTNNPEALASAFYQWCDNHEVVIDWLTYSHHMTIQEIVAGRKDPKVEDYGRTISCVNAQAYIYDELESMIRASTLLKSEYVRLLAPKRRARLRNAVYAKHGKDFSDPALRDWFKKRPWYITRPAFSEESLSSQDRENIKTIVSAERDP